MYSKNNKIGHIILAGKFNKCNKHISEFASNEALFTYIRLLIKKNNSERHNAEAKHRITKIIIIINSFIILYLVRVSHSRFAGRQTIHHLKIVTARHLNRRFF